MSHPLWQKVFRRLSDGRYAPPSRGQAGRLVKEIHADIESAKTKALNDRGPWALVHDGASSKDDSLVNLLAVNARNEVIHISTKGTGYKCKT
eukprot:14369010-Alexandrium_andersonii.AAC.1